MHTEDVKPEEITEVVRTGLECPTPAKELCQNAYRVGLPIIHAGDPSCAEATEVDHTGGVARETLLGFKRPPLRSAQRLQSPPPITVEILHTSDECRLLRLSVGLTAHLDAVIVTPDGGLECARELSGELGDGLERAYAACLALRGRCDFVYIQQLWVQESFRTLGYGTALMKFFLGENNIRFVPTAGFVALCAQPEVYAMDSHSRDRLDAFYKRLGFVRLDESVSIMYKLCTVKEGKTSPRKECRVY